MFYRLKFCTFGKYGVDKNDFSYTMGAAGERRDACSVIREPRLMIVQYGVCNIARIINHATRLTHHESRSLNHIQ